MDHNKNIFEHLKKCLWANQSHTPRQEFQDIPNTKSIKSCSALQAEILILIGFHADVNARHCQFCERLDDQ